MTENNSKIFKAYDIRGKYPLEIDEKIVSEIAGKLADFFPAGKIVIAHDARLSSPGLYQAVVSRLWDFKNKLNIIEVGLATTPMFYFLVKKEEAIGGIMVTASHNPKEYNGLKVVDKDALPISGTEILKLL